MRTLFALFGIGLFLGCTFANGQNGDYGKFVPRETTSRLPQSPAEDRVGTDARDAKLKGRVRRVTEYTHYSGSPARRIDMDSFYNEAGNLTKTVAFDRNGSVEGVIDYGFVDGMRVGHRGDVTYLTGSRPSFISFLGSQIADLPGDAKLRGDTRYLMRWVRKYDAEGRLTEVRRLRNTGELLEGMAYRYDGSSRSEREFGGDEKESGRSEYLSDPSGAETRVTMYFTDGQPAEKYSRKYEFDKQGNWIVERTYLDGVGKAAPKLRWISFRTITYYP